MGNGEFFSYYIDQIRAGSYLEKYSQEEISTYFDEYFLFLLNNEMRVMTGTDKYNYLSKLDNTPLIINYS